ncbi:MAG: hypothetical protein LQ348_004076 [Seirophora lacunosa]|nr:MAG: hypothetical protein LQ348_004076 [Seirophora lacunosa]
MSNNENSEVQKVPLTPREAELAVIALQCLQSGEVKIDWDKFTAMAEYKNKNSAQTNFQSVLKNKFSQGTLKKHYVVSSSSVSGRAKAATATCANPKKRTPKAKAKAVATDDDNADTTNDTTNDTTPEKPKKKRATKPKPKPTAAAEPTDDNDANKANGTTDSVTPKKRARKEKSSTPAAAKRVKQEHKPEPEVKEEETMPAATDGVESAGCDGKFFDAAIEAAAEEA